jgi:N-acetylmuramoyl-L-alanine amidase
MAPWAKSLLLGGMIWWTIMTAIAGWFAVRGSAAGGVSDPDQRVLAGSVVGTPVSLTPTRSAETPSSRAAGAATWMPTAVPTATSTAVLATSTPRIEPDPQYVQDAGVDADASDFQVGAPVLVRDAARTSAKGVIVLDPGHGRGDPGAVHHLPDGTPDVLESESNLLNAQLIRDELVAMGYDVYLTRDDAGRGPNGPLVQQFIVSDLLWRVALAAAVDADAFLAIHGNGASVTSISGPETWYCGKHEQGSANESLAAKVQMAMMDALHEYGYFPPDRGIMEDAERHHSGDFCQFVVTRENTIPSALLEFLFLSNDDDARVLADRKSHEILARHVAKALDDFLSERRAAGQ